MIDIYVINLPNRIDKKLKIIKLFSMFKSINLHFIEAISKENGAIGCFLSHKKCIQFAKENNMKLIIVIEDDCLPLNNFESNLQKTLDFLSNKDIEWDIFLGGITYTQKSDIIRKINCNNLNFYNIQKAHCTHFMIYNETSYDFFLNFNEELEPIDNCWHNQLKAFTIAPYLAKQYSSYSDIIKCEANYMRKFNKTEKILLEFM